MLLLHRISCGLALAGLPVRRADFLSIRSIEQVAHIAIDQLKSMPRGQSLTLFNKERPFFPSHVDFLDYCFLFFVIEKTFLT